MTHSSLKYFQGILLFMFVAFRNSLLKVPYLMMKIQLWETVLILSIFIIPLCFSIKVLGSSFMFPILNINKLSTCLSVSYLEVARHSSIAFRKYDYYSGALEIQDLENCTRCDPFYILTRNWSRIRILKFHVSYFGDCDRHLLKKFIYI